MKKLSDNELNEALDALHIAYIILSSDYRHVNHAYKPIIKQLEAKIEALNKELDKREIEI
jgi:hypothetical protein